MDDLWLGLRLLLLLTVANNAPIGAKLLLRGRWNAPLDGGRQFVDGRPLLGPSKTWRGLAAAVLVTALCAPLLDFSPATGALAALLSMAGDALASFCKRRLGIASSGQAFGLDQLPESLLPLLALQPLLGLSATVVVGVTVAFVLFETPAARLAHRIGWRDRPY
jgi:CDP-diglyceride synthetase